VDFIKSFLLYTKNYESPTSFWKWAAYSTVSAVLRDNCFIRQLDILVYPNIYVLIMAGSAHDRKDLPVKMATDLVAKIKNTKVIAGRTSIQAILDELARPETNERGILITGGSAIFSAPELSAGLVGDADAVTIMTDIYGYRDNYTSRLRGSGIFHIKKVCFSMLAASNKDLLISIYDTKAVFGGLLGRTFLIIPDEYRESNSLFRNLKRPYEFEDLIPPLKEIANLKGEVLLEDKAIDEYEAWYKPFRSSLKNKPDKSGVAGRIHTGVLKIAMILAINETHELRVKKEHIEDAIEECVNLMPNYNQLTMSSGKSQLSEVGSILINEIYKSEDHQISKRKLLQRNWMHFDAETVDKLINSFITAGFIDQFQEGNDVMYKMTKVCIEKLYEVEK
jgi:hypothetical protein